jgi:peroxiredoxin
MSQPQVYLKRRSGWTLMLLPLLWLLATGESCKRQQGKDQSGQSRAEDRLQTEEDSAKGDTIQFVLEGEIEGAGGLVAELYQVGAPGGRKLVAQTECDRKGRFTIVHQHYTPRVYKIEFGTGHKYLYLARDTVRVKGNVEEISKLGVYNSDLTAQLYEFWRSSSQLKHEDRHYGRKARKASSQSLKKAYRDTAQRMKATESERLDRFYRSFIESTDTSMVSARAAVEMQVYPNYAYLRSLAEYYQEHYPYLFETRQLVDKLDYYRQVVPGSKAPAVSAPDTSGQTVHLSDFRGKFVLLTFWLSASSRAREQMQDLRPLSREIGRDRLVLLNYSFNQNKSLWIRTIEEDQLPGIHISDLAGYDVPVTRDYLIDNVPRYYLIDPKGRILNRFARAEKAVEEIRALLAG